MMNKEQNRLLADIRELTLELESSRLSLRDQDYLKLSADILKQLRADGAPMYPVVKFAKSIKNVYLDDGFPILDVEEQTEGPEPDPIEQWPCPGCQTLLFIRRTCHVCGHE